MSRLGQASALAVGVIALSAIAAPIAAQEENQQLRKQIEHQLARLGLKGISISELDVKALGEVELILNDNDNDGTRRASLMKAVLK